MSFKSFYSLKSNRNFKLVHFSFVRSIHLVFKSTLYLTTKDFSHFITPDDFFQFVLFLIVIRVRFPIVYIYVLLYGVFYYTDLQLVYMIIYLAIFQTLLIKYSITIIRHKFVPKNIRKTYKRLRAILQSRLLVKE